MAETILIIDDDPSFRKQLGQTLKDYGYLVAEAGTGKAGVSMTQKQSPDLIILDLVLPGIHGIDVCQILKQKTETAGIPILMLTGKDTEGQDIACLDMGADGSLTKPVKAERLLSHCRALLRRAPAENKKSGALRLGPLRLDYNQKLARIGGRDISHLTPKEFSILYDLAARSPGTRDRTSLYRDLWGMDPPSEGSLKTVDVHVRRIRLKLGWKSDEWIIYINGRGYCLKLPK
ncbi:MAG: hypothetical protein A3J74_09290 [Elusimicrobia bacterium RIFCSPHIGHO2_02_FULL_57_9]|nr:MAG: hypothetical protein A3J74_09290 [Elusimicrobia bacterium RIFCSPHIGHO2_02_FULL_57_9]